jgi:pantoate--beta-alanine ligase
MRLVRTPSALRVALDALPPPTTVGFVPTMGSLHAGHVALVDASVAACDVTVVSIFVNPAQFAPAEDLGAYPRTEEADLALLRTARVDIAFLPAPGDVYPPGYSSYLTTGVGGADANPASEGASRPTFFRGVATVVAKLLILVRPDRAYFGRKDAQQCAVVRRLAEDLWLGKKTRIVCVDTVREEDGLAMSSRNVYLGDAERREAPVLYRALREGRRLVADGERDAGTVRGAIRGAVEEWRATAGAGLDFELIYVSVCRASDMREVDGAIGDGDEVLACIAAKLGKKARLIDNLVLVAP